MESSPEKASGVSHSGIVMGLLFAIFLWGGNNAGVKYLVTSWPPVMVGSTRFLCAGWLMVFLLRRTRWLGSDVELSAAAKRSLWLRGGLSLAAYIVVFNVAVHYTAASHVALELAISPIWALLWEGRVKGARMSDYAKRYAAALLALAGVVVLFLPALRSGSGTLKGELLGLGASVLWTLYGRQCRVLGGRLPAPVVTAHTMWRAGMLMLPVALVEMMRQPVHWEMRLIVVQAYCVIAGGIVAFAFWNHGLSHWKTSEVYLFNNLIPLSTMAWAHYSLGEPVSPSFWLAMALVIVGVVIGQADWQAWFGNRWFPAD